MSLTARHSKKAGKTPSGSHQRQGRAECQQHIDGLTLPSVPSLIARQNVILTDLSSIAFKTLPSLSVSNSS